jgi:murein L,D-transpeptidase YcbB/YkuD
LRQCNSSDAGLIGTQPLPANDPARIVSTFFGASIMQKMTILAVASMFAAAPALADNPPGATGTVPHPPKPAAVTPHPHPAPAKQAAPASTPEQRSAEALALTHEPTFDEGTAQRIREAAFSYSDIAVRGGWPAIPTEAKFAIGVAGQHDDLLRKRLLMSGDLAGDKDKGAHDETVVEAWKRFQSRHGLAPTGTMTPRTLAALNVSVHKRIRQLEASLERLGATKFSFGQRYVVVNLPATYAEAIENDVVVRRYRVVVG